MNRVGVPVTMETTAGKHGGNANMFTWRCGKEFAKGPETQQHFNTCDTLRIGSACARITLQAIEKHKSPRLYIHKR